MGSAQEEVRQEPRALWEKMQAERTACAKAPGGGMCWPPAHKGRGQLGASVAREGVSRRGGEQEGVSRRGRDPRGRRGRSRRAWRAAASCLNKMQSGGFREKRSCLSKATLAPRGSELTMGGGRREGRVEATAMV